MAGKPLSTEIQKYKNNTVEYFERYNCKIQLVQNIARDVITNLFPNRKTDQQGKTCCNITEILQTTLNRPI